ncbi:MAG: ROK family protein [Candidatus Rokubacteria bacterium]|nr:ROK family protein [Candidatus Rokubacteria bacterium]
MTEEAAVLGADVGGTGIGVGVVTASGEVRRAAEAPTLGGGPGTVVETLLALLAGTQAQAAGAGIRLIGCGIGVPGAVDAAAGQIGRDVQNLPELAGCPLAALVRARTGLPTVLDNDVNALTLGEARFGVARGLRSVVLLALGTGVGGGLYLNGDIVRGASGYGGELGHVTVNFDGRPCFCGGRGCLKAYVAGPDIAAQAREALAGRPGSALLALAGGDPAAITAPHVFAAARAGDALAREIVEGVCRALGAGLGSILNGLNPEAIVLTGGVAHSLEAHMDDVLRWTRAYAFEGAYQAAKVLVVPMTKTTSIRGSAALFFHEAVRRAGAAGPS